MRFTEALNIVLDLAEHNVLTDKQCSTKRELRHERDRQLHACADIAAWAANMFGKEWRDQ